MKLIAGLVATASVATAADWAVIVAGSYGYGNYRHQADACHAYKVTREFGIPAEQIITMMYDDIASSSSNPFKGKVFNKPTKVGDAGVDVYAGCKIDYKGSDVTPANFVNVLTGASAKTGGKPVLKSTAQDRVFVNFVDHGGTGLIAFPSQTMSATQLNSALKTMHSTKMYSQLTFYMEACESGSMFEGLLDPSLNIYVTTASNAEESSWGTYCPPDDMINGKAINSCLGDLYSVNWMENAESAGKSETLQEQFDSIKTSTDKSHVMQYGDLSFTSEPISDFLGDGGKVATKGDSKTTKSTSNVPSPDIPLHLAYYNYLRADKSDYSTRMELAKGLQTQLASQIKVDTMFHELTKTVASQTNGDASSLFHGIPKTPIVCGECCDTVYAAITDGCGGFTDYSLQYSRVVVNLCSHVGQDAAAAAKIASTLKAMC